METKPRMWKRTTKIKTPKPTNTNKKHRTKPKNSLTFCCDEMSSKKKKKRLYAQAK